MQPQVSEDVRSPQQAPALTHTHSSPAPLLVNFQQHQLWSMEAFPTHTNTFLPTYSTSVQETEHAMFPVKSET